MPSRLASSSSSQRKPGSILLLLFLQLLLWLVFPIVAEAKIKMDSSFGWMTILGALD